MVIGGGHKENMVIGIECHLYIGGRFEQWLELEQSQDDFNDCEDDVFHLESHHGEYECGYGEKGFHLINTLHTIQ